MVSDRESELVLQVSGQGAWELFRHEAGGHRWQRVPPTESNGRRHSSTFTVAVFQDHGATRSAFSEQDVEIQATIGHGPGGQHRQKNATAIRAIHRPTGIVVFQQSERSQRDNLRLAIDTLRARVDGAAAAASHGRVNQDRQQQIGTGERSDKIRTVQEQNDRVIDHRTGKKISVARYLKGEIWRLHG